MSRVLFIDPGDVHVGIALYKQLDSGVWVADQVVELTPPESEDMVAEYVQDESSRVIGWERFKLYGHLATQQTGSEFWTSQLIGAYKYIVRTKGHPDLKTVIQDAVIQTSTEKVAAYRKVPLRSVLAKQGPHAKSAELHALYYLLRQESQIQDWRTK